MSCLTACGAATATKVVTVNAVTTPPAPERRCDHWCIDRVCQGATTALTQCYYGWRLEQLFNRQVATVSTSGLVAGVAAGTATISYTVGAASATKVITVNALPTAGNHFRWFFSSCG
jgi:hypothetical protein